MKANPPYEVLAAIFERILEDLEPFLPFKAAGVFLEDAGLLQLVVTRREFPHLPGTTVQIQHAPGYLHLQQTMKPLLQGESPDESDIHCIFGDLAIDGWMAIPVTVDNALVGTVVFASSDTKFQHKDAHLAQTLIKQAALLLEKAQLADSLAIEKRNIELLFELNQDLSTTLDLQQVAERAVLLTTNVFNVAFGEIMLIDPVNPDKLLLYAVVADGVPARSNTQDYPFLNVGHGTAGWVALHHKAVIAANVDEAPSWIPLSGIISTVRSTAALPLIVHDQLIGVLQLSSTQTGFFHAEMLTTLQAVAAPVAMALHNARLFSAEQNRYKVTEALRLSTSTLILDLDLPDLLQKLLERLQQVVPFDSTSCFLLKGNAIQAVAQIGLPNPEESLNRTFPIDDKVHWLMRKRIPFFEEDVSQVSWFQQWGETNQIRGWMAVPLVHRGRFIGCITLDSHRPGTYGPREAEVAQAFANQAATTIVNAQLLQESRRTAKEQSTVSEIMRRLNATSAVSEILPAIDWGLRALTECDAVELAIFDNDELEASIIRRTYQKDGSIAESRYTVAIHESLALQSNLKGQIFQTGSDAVGTMLRLEAIDSAQGFAAQIAIPMQVNQRVLGSLRLLWHLPPANDISGTAIAQIAEAVAMTTQKNQLLCETRRRVEEMETINQLTATLRPLESQSAIINVSLSFIQKTIDCHVVRLCLFDSNNLLNLVAEVGKPSTTQRTFPHDGTIFGHIAQTGLPYLSSNYPHDPLAHPEILEDWVMLGVQPITAIFAPVFAGSTVMGVIAGYCFTHERVYGAEDLHLLATIADIIGTALHRSSILDTMEHRIAERTRQLAEANERLQELDRLKSEFIANVSHELRTPLTNIRFYADLLRRGRADKHDEYLQTLQIETQQLNALIESVLDLSRLNAARIQGIFFEVTTFSLTVLLSDVCQLYTRQAQAKGITLHYVESDDIDSDDIDSDDVESDDIDSDDVDSDDVESDDVESDDPLKIDADRSQINQVIGTLLANAIAYTDPGGQVEVSAHLSHNKGVQITVQDTGMGILPHELPRLFERFFRGAEATERGIPGVGLGLSIVKEILDLHGGTIRLESKVGKGTIVSVWLPTTRPASPHANSTDTATDHLAITEKATQTNDGI
ncbi:GAF domain-containing protein [bacterium]|nr:GAF domain-containing protein [bacterium]